MGNHECKDVLKKVERSAVRIYKGDDHLVANDNDTGHVPRLAAGSGSTTHNFYHVKGTVADPRQPVSGGWQTASSAPRSPCTLSTEYGKANII